MERLGAERCVAAILSWITRKKYRRDRQLVSWKKIRENAVRYAHFPKYTLPASLLDVFTQQIPVFFISKFFTMSLTGHFNLAYRILSIPVSLIGASVAQVFYQEFSTRYHHDAKEARALLVKVWRALFLIGVGPMAVFFLWGEGIFGIVFGEAWRDAGRMASVISPLLLAMFVSSPTSTSYMVLHMQKYSLLYAVASLIYRPVCFYLGYLKHDLWVSLKLWTGCEVVAIFVYGYVAWKRMKARGA